MRALFFRPIGATVDLEKSCKMSIYLQNLVPIQPKTSEILQRFAKNWQLPYGSQRVALRAAAVRVAGRVALRGALPGVRGSLVKYCQLSAVQRLLRFENAFFSRKSSVAILYRHIVLSHKFFFAFYVLPILYIIVLLLFPRFDIFLVFIYI